MQFTADELRDLDYVMGSYSNSEALNYSTSVQMACQRACRLTPTPRRPAPRSRAPPPPKVSEGVQAGAPSPQPPPLHLPRRAGQVGANAVSCDSVKGVYGHRWVWADFIAVQREYLQGLFCVDTLMTACLLAVVTLPGYAVGVGLQQEYGNGLPINLFITTANLLFAVYNDNAAIVSSIRVFGGSIIAASIAVIVILVFAAWDTPTLAVLLPIVFTISWIIMLLTFTTNAFGGVVFNVLALTTYDPSTSTLMTALGGRLLSMIVIAFVGLGVSVVIPPIWHLFIVRRRTRRWIDQSFNLAANCIQSYQHNVDRYNSAVHDQGVLSNYINEVLVVAPMWGRSRRLKQVLKQQLTALDLGRQFLTSCNNLGFVVYCLGGLNVVETLYRLPVGRVIRDVRCQCVPNVLLPPLNLGSRVVLDNESMSMIAADERVTSRVLQIASIMETIRSTGFYSEQPPNYIDINIIGLRARLVVQYQEALRRGSGMYTNIDTIPVGPNVVSDTFERHNSTMADVFRSRGISSATYSLTNPSLAETAINASTQALAERPRDLHDTTEERVRSVLEADLEHAPALLGRSERIWEDGQIWRDPAEQLEAAAADGRRRFPQKHRHCGIVGNTLDNEIGISTTNFEPVQTTNYDVSHLRAYSTMSQRCYRNEVLDITMPSPENTVSTAFSNPSASLVDTLPLVTHLSPASARRLGYHSYGAAVINDYIGPTHVSQDVPGGHISYMALLGAGWASSLPYLQVLYSDVFAQKDSGNQGLTGHSPITIVQEVPAPSICPPALAPLPLAELPLAEPTKEVATNIELDETPGTDAADPAPLHESATTSEKPSGKSEDDDPPGDPQDDPQDDPPQPKEEDNSKTSDVVTEDIATGFQQADFEGPQLATDEYGSADRQDVHYDYSYERAQDHLSYDTNQLIAAARPVILAYFAVKPFNMHSIVNSLGGFVVFDEGFDPFSESALPETVGDIEAARYADRVVARNEMPLDDRLEQEEEELDTEGEIVNIAVRNFREREIHEDNY